MSKRFTIFDFAKYNKQIKVLQTMTVQYKDKYKMVMVNRWFSKSVISYEGVLGPGPTLNVKVIQCAIFFTLCSISLSLLSPNWNEWQRKFTYIWRWNLLFSQKFSFTVVGQNLYQQSKHILLQLTTIKIDKEELISVLAKVTEKELLFLWLQVIEGASCLLAQKC